MARLDNQDPVIKKTAIYALDGQSNLREETLKQITVRLEDEYPGVRMAAIDVLSSPSSLEEVTLNQIAARLEGPRSCASLLDNPDWVVRRAAIEALERQSNLPDVRLNQIAARLGDQDSDIRRAATDALSSRSNLPEVILNQIAALLEDQDLDVKTASMDTLGSKPNLPEGVLNQIARQLKGHGLFAVDRVAPMIMEHHKFHFVCLVGGHAQGLLPLLLKQSFNNHLAWYIQDGKSYLQTDNRLGCVELLHGESNLEVALQRAREHAAIPAVGASLEAELGYSAA
ncbi:predicted protein [Aspergillus terreus NIH2624]|uniref:HEAT repeat domain-containing protein n=1 Tax=Aspergillus terreus (strain NIH 2624 / FGSC A1156) TaxID=341663 RepID=Q0CRV0_ASPTN|nr:uncharacterized protein ATEG_03584 [Aspergillus terreus NIH2624]EAU35386.1 predicted protein [Aspergillus terreus NIH2624]